ncbi:insulinase family protein [Defluviitalea phaphyphila]|uniref:insulinase family protein n=1 Tax=Defluviitalea phaphyphila TaxID=1473580 RepID=UPI00073173AB|nr:insulinase family protein [Defluviitalea phaphyphila]
MELNDIVYGFRLLEKQEIKEVNSTAYIFVHEKSGAKLLSLQNDDKNKVFAITFRTPPQDNTGLPHILEHSVLCGSRKFPTKDPFVELAKGSLNTYLNAMTFSDKTMYPIASTNDKDFFNLMDVYLDAVFYPNIYKYPEILMQEGWHYELQNKDDEITYNGVVYNEMKGAFSSPESILFRKIEESLFPDTPYGKESGGDPEYIPDLTYEDFIKFHRKYYHPSNSYIYLYGNGNLEKQLEFIDREYLSNFDRKSIDSNIPIQKAFDNIKEININYPISPEETEKEKTFLSLNYVIDKSTNPEIYLAFQILEYLLLETPAAPLKKAILDAGIGKDVFGSFDTSIQQPTFSIIVKNSDKEKAEKFQKTVKETLTNLVNKGIDKKLIKAAVNSKEFILREADSRNYPKGLIYAIKVMSTWLYDKNPLINLKYEPILEKIKDSFTAPYFENLIKKYLLNNTHGTLIILTPKKGLLEEKTQKIREKLLDYKNKLSDEEIEKLIIQTKQLKKRQITPDNPKDIEKIPLLSLEDLNKKAEKLPQVEKEEEGVKVLFHPMFTNKITYLNLYFDLKGLDQKLIPYAGMLVGILSKMDTKNYEYADLSNEINIHTGGISIYADTFGINGKPNEYESKLILKSKALTKKFPELINLIREIITSTSFENEKRLLEIIREMKSRMEMVLFDQGHMVVANRLLSYFSEKDRYNEELKGFSFYQFVTDIEEKFETKKLEVINNLKETAKQIFNKNNLLIGITSQEEDYEEIRKYLSILFEDLNDNVINKKKYSFNEEIKNEGLMTQSNVQYVAKGYNFLELGYSYSGKLQVLKTIIGLDYLWNKVRVQGGAYGAFINFSRTGNVFFSSYRDPNLKRTLNIYDEVGKYLAEFNASRRDMTKYIIGTISRYDHPLTPSMKGEKAVSQYISKITYEDTQKEREEILSTTKEDIVNFKEMMEKLSQQNYICVMGNKNIIKENKDIFENIIDVFK